MNVSNVLVYSPRYKTDMSVHGISVPFALDRGELVLDALAPEYSVDGKIMRTVCPRPLSRRDLALVHTTAYLKSLKKPSVWADIFGLQYQSFESVPASLPALLDDVRLKGGGTLLAAKLALEYGAAANLGAGYHHAFADRGEGFCAINDIAIAIRRLQKDRLCGKAMVVDVDLHQGNGTANIFKADESVFTLSIHSEEAWPFHKERSDKDISLRFGESRLYLPALKEALICAMDGFHPQLVLFVQGSDAYEKDAVTTGRSFKLTLEQCRERDEFVIDACVDRDVAVALVFAGGYGKECWRVHYNAVRHLLHRLSGMQLRRKRRGYPVRSQP